MKEESWRRWKMKEEEGGGKTKEEEDEGGRRRRWRRKDEGGGKTKGGKMKGFFCLTLVCCLKIYILFKNTIKCFNKREKKWVKWAKVRSLCLTVLNICEFLGSDDEFLVFFLEARLNWRRELRIFCNLIREIGGFCFAVIFWVDFGSYDNILLP